MKRLRPSSTLPPRSDSLAKVGLLSLFVALVIAAVEAQATVVVMHSLEQMSQRADVVVHARVTDQVVTREDGRIITLTELEVVDGLKGAKYGDVLTVYQVGGKLDGVVAKIAGMHEYFVGEELVLFGMNHGDRVVSYGVGVGKFQVQYEDDGKVIQPRVVEDILDVVVARRDDSGATQFTPPSPRSHDSLEGFKAELRSYIRAVRTPERFQPRLHPKQLQAISPKTVKGGR
jgi:hypothetical protein